jgi:hypothetical protein
MKFKHLDDIDQTYSRHFRQAMMYSFKSLKNSFYFFIHGIWPDCFVYDGSESIKELHEHFQQRATNP